MNKDIKKSAEKINILHQQFSRYGTNAKEWMRKCVLLLPDIARNEVWKKKRFKSIYEYGSKLAGMSKNTVDEALWIMKKIEDKPELQKIVETRGVNRIRPIINLVTKENQSFWAEKASNLSQNTLRAYAQEFRVNPSFQSVNLQNPEIFDEKLVEGNDAKFDQKTPPVKVTIAMQVDKEVAEELRKYEDLNALMKELLALKKAKLEAEKPPVKEDTSRHIPNPTQRFINERSQGKCEYPGCKKAAHMQHHADRYAMYKTHDPDRIFDLCKSHEDLCHQGLVANEEKPIAFWEVKEKQDVNHSNYRIDKVAQRHRQY